MDATLSVLDIAIVVVYLVAIIGMSYVFARRQQTGEDYFSPGATCAPFRSRCRFSRTRPVR